MYCVATLVYITLRSTLRTPVTQFGLSLQLYSPWWDLRSLHRNGPCSLSGIGVGICCMLKGWFLFLIYSNKSEFITVINQHLDQIICKTTVRSKALFYIVCFDNISCFCMMEYPIILVAFFPWIFDWILGQQFKYLQIKKIKFPNIRKFVNVTGHKFAWCNLHSRKH